MRAIIYQFTVKENGHDEFIQAWTEMTELFIKYEHSLGSRLHRKDHRTYIAYAQWPDKATFDHAGSNLPENAHALREKMRSFCEGVEQLFDLTVVEDLLRS